jgi:acyl-CoA thioesterase I
MILRTLVFVLITLAATAETSAFYRVLLIGDSVGTGYGVEDHESFPRLLADGMRTNRAALRLVNLSQNGLTTSGAEFQLEKLLQFAGQPEIFILEVGGNDFLAKVDASVVQTNVSRILATVRKLHPRAKLVVVGIGYPAGPRSPYRIAAESAGALCVEGFAWDDPENKTGRQKDNIHPAPAGHREIADALLTHLK